MIVFLFSPEKGIWNFHWRQFAWNVKSCFLEKKKKNLICRLLKILPRMLSINILMHFYLSHKVRNILFDKSAQWKRKSVYASVQSDQSLHCPHEETLHPQNMSSKYSGQTLCWSESLLGAHDQTYVFWHYISYAGFQVALKFLRNPYFMNIPKISKTSL